MPQCSLVLGNTASSAWGMVAWRGRGAFGSESHEAYEMLQPLLGNGDSCHGFKISKEIQSTESAISHWTCYLLGENFVLTLTPKPPMRSSVLCHHTSVNREAFVSDSSLSQATYPFCLRIPSLPGLHTTVCLPEKESEVGEEIPIHYWAVKASVNMCY